MLTLAALENKQYLTRTETVYIAELVDDIVESKQAMILSKQIGLTIHIPKDVSVPGDRFWLRQAVANLVQNAIDFSLAQGQITISTQTGNQTVILMVSDCGATIPAYALEKIFDKFYSLKRPDSGRKSTGLGLNLVQQVATLHNGRIELKNRDPKGVLAILTLPAA
jgi:two-component system sensor histidine kinase CreC